MKPVISESEFQAGWIVLAAAFRFEDREGAPAVYYRAFARLVTPEAWRWLVDRVIAMRDTAFGPTVREMLDVLEDFPGGTYREARSEALDLAAHPNATIAEVRLYRRACLYAPNALGDHKREWLAAWNSFRAKHVLPMVERDRKALTAVKAEALTLHAPAPVKALPEGTSEEALDLGASRAVVSAVESKVRQ